jgi:protein-tyrosine phosphatase
MGNIGPISRHALQGLHDRGIDVARPIRSPLQVAADDFASCTRVVAMSGSEHGKMVTDQFPLWADVVEYWDIDDVALCAPEAALAKIDDRIRDMRAELNPRA